MNDAWPGWFCSFAARLDLRLLSVSTVMLLLALLGFPYLRPRLASEELPLALSIEE